MVWRSTLHYIRGGAEKPVILVTGALGQIGVELIPWLRKNFGDDHVVATDLINRPPAEWHGPFEQLDVTNRSAFEAIIEHYKVDWLIHNAALLSGTGEKDQKGFDLTMEVNIHSMETALELAKIHGLLIYTTSSIGAFGPESGPKAMMPDVVVQRPTTIYGISKMYAEVLGSYYHRKWGVDFRCLRFPGVISWKQRPSGGTTDFSVESFYCALSGEEYVCPLKPDTPLPMMYMPDCLKCLTDFLTTPRSSLKQCVYNVNAFSLTPRQCEEGIKKEIPEFKMKYAPDFRQGIAESWPEYLDSHNAKEQWGFAPQFDIPAVFRDMMTNLRLLLRK